MMGFIVPLVVLTLLAGGGGVVVGKQIVSMAGAKPAEAAEGKAGEAAEGKPAAVAANVPIAASSLKELNPVVTNLAAPDGAWVRLQTAIVYDKKDAPQIDVLAATIGDDILAFVKTLTVAQLQGANGLQQLREDLNERAALRSDGHVREVLIETLVIQ